MTTEIGCPYKGLASFVDSDHDVQFFFGREREREIICANLMASKLTVLYGDTGVGKSSVLRAGVAHSLRSHDDPPAVVVFDAWKDDPAAGLVDALAAAAGIEPRATLADTLEACSAKLAGEVYVILDGVEEYFLYHEGEEGPGTFFAEFPQAVKQAGLRASFLLSVQEDALAKLDRFKASIPNLFGNYLRLAHLDREAARSAITGPIEQYNRLVEASRRVEIEAELVDAVLDEVVAGKVDVGQTGRGAVRDRASRDDRIEAPYLQLVMHRLWEVEEEAGSRTLRASTLSDLGGAEAIVRAHLERALDSLTTDEKDMASAVFNHLVTPSGTKIAHAVPDLARYAGAPEERLEPVLSTLAHERILRPAAADGGAPRYEIYHDVLGDAVLAWRVGHEADRELVGEREAAARRQRRLLAVLGAGGVLLAVMAGVTAFALTQRTEARKQAAIANRQRSEASAQARLASAGELAAKARSELEVDPQLGLVLAVKSARVRYTREGEEVLRDALLQPRQLVILPSAGPVDTASFSPNGRFVVTASDDGTARIWSAASGRTVRIFRPGGRVISSSFSPDGRLLLTAGSNGAATIWRTSTGRRLHIFQHKARVTAAFFSSDGRLVVTASLDGTTRLWRTKTGALVRLIRVGGPVDKVALSPDDRLLVAMSYDRVSQARRARVYDAISGRFLHELRETGITTATFSPDGNLIATGSLGGSGAIWNARSGTRLNVLANYGQGPVTSVSFGPNGKLVVTTSTDGVTRVWYTATGVRAFALLGHTLPVVSASWSRSHPWLITTSLDGTARVWQAFNGRSRAVLRGHLDTVVGASFNRSDTAIVTASKDGTARIWDAGTAPDLQLLAKDERPLTSAAWSPDGRLIAVASADGRVRILDARGRAVRVLREQKPTAGVEFNADGSLLVSAGGRVVHVRRADDGATVRTIRQPAIVDALSVSRDGKLLVTGGRDGRARIWTTDGRLVRTLNQRFPVTAASFSPDARLVVTAGADGVGRMWDVRTGALRRSLRGHRATVTSAIFSPNGRRVVTVSRDHDMRIWSVATGKRVRVVHAHFGPVFSSSLSPDGRWIVTAGPTTAGLWDGLTGRLLLYLRGHSAALTDATFSPDGRRILTVSRDGSARVYDCVPCRGVDGLLAVAEARLARIARPLTPTARDRYLPR